MSVLLQWAGAVVCLVAFAFLQRGSWPAASYPYLAFNLVGGGMLSTAAGLAHQWGFVLLEGIWAGVAGWGVARRLRGWAPVRFTAVRDKEDGDGRQADVVRLPR